LQKRKQGEEKEHSRKEKEHSRKEIKLGGKNNQP